MKRYKGVLSLTVWAAAVVFFAPPASACVWCDSAQWLNFQDCLNWKIRNEPSFGQISVGALDDMRDSITAASQAITKGRSSMKMKMLVGAMAGELSEMIKPVSSNGNDGRPKALLMNIVQVCNVDVVGQPDLGFIDELSRTLDFMMNEPSYDNPAPNDNDNAFPQTAIQSPTNFNGQNINVSPPDFNNMRQPQSQQQLPSAESINAVPYRGNNQQAPSGITFPNNQNAGSRFPTQAVPGQREINAASLSYPPQPQITNGNGASGFNTLNQNPSINPSFTNVNTASKSYSIAQNPGLQQQIDGANFERNPDEMYQYPTAQANNANVNPGSRPYPLNPGYSNQPQITRANAESSANSYNLASANRISNTDQNIPQNNIQNQFPPRDIFPEKNQGPSYPTNNLQNQQFPSQPINQPQSSFKGSETKTFEINAQNVPQNNQKNQYNQYSVSNGNGLGQSGAYSLINNQRQTDQTKVGKSPYNALPSNYDSWFPNQDYPNNPAANTPYGSPSGSSVATNSNSQSFVTQGGGNFPGNYPAVTNKPPKNGKKIQNRTPGLKKKKQNKRNGVTNQKRLLPSPNDDDVGRAMIFVKTFYVILSQSNDFKSVFNDQIPNDQALSLAYTIDVGALNDCGYSRFSVEIANACTVFIQSLPDGCSYVKYAEALSKALMDQLNMKNLIGENPEGQAKCIANNLLTRLNQKISTVIAITTTQAPLAAESKSTFFQDQDSQPQLTNANSPSYSLYQNPDIQPQLINSKGARIYRPNTDQNIPQNNLQNQFPRGNNVPINNAVPGDLISESQNQKNFTPGPLNQQPDSSAIATNKNIKSDPNLQNTDRAYNEEGIKNAAINFYQKLFNNLLTCPYISSIYNELTTKTDAKTNTVTLLLGSLSADYDNLATEIARECVRRLGSVQPGSNTEVYTTLIATCITEGFSYYGLISQETPSAQASDISSKIIAWLKGDTDSGNNNQQSNKKIDVQSNVPNQGAMDYPYSYSGVPNLTQGQQPPLSEILSSNYGRNTDYNPNADDLAPQYQQYNYQNFDSNSPPITNGGLQNIKTSSNGNTSLIKTNINKGKNRNSNRNNKQKNKRAKKKKIAVSKTNFNFDNLNNYYPYNDYPINNAVKSKSNSPTDINNGDYFRGYGANLNYPPNNVPNTQWPESQNYPAQNVNQDDNLTSGAIKIQNDNISGPQQSDIPSALNNYPPNNVPNTQWSGFQNYPAQNVNQDDDLTSGATKIQNDSISVPQEIALPSALNNSPRRKKCKSLKNGKGNNATIKPPISDDLNASNYPLNQRVPSALDMTNNPQTFQSNENAGSPSNGYDAIPHQNASPVSSQSQIIPDERNDEVRDRIRYLTKGVLSSTTNGKFDYRLFSDIIAELTENLQITHPELGSQTSLIKTLIDSIIACTQLLTKVPPNYFDDIGVMQNSDISDAAAIIYSNRISPINEDQSTRQTNQNNVALNDQSYGPPALPQQNNLNNDQIENIYPGSSAPLSNTNVPPPRQGSVNNVALNDQSYGPSTLPQQNNLNNDQIGKFYPGRSVSLPNTNVPPPRQGAANNVALNDQSYGPPILPQQNNLNNDQIGNFYPGGSVSLTNTNVPPPRQGTVNNVALNDQGYGPPILQQQNNLNNDQIGNFYPGGSVPLPNTNVPPLRQGTVNNVALSDQSYRPPTLPQKNNLNNDQIGQRIFYTGGLDSLPGTNVPPPRQDFGILSASQGVRGNGLSNAQTYRGISSQIGQDNSLPILPNGYGSQNLPLNNQNNLAGGFNNPNLQPGNIGNQNIQSGNSLQTGLPQGNQMYDTNLPQNNQMLNLPGGPSQNLFK